MSVPVLSLLIIVPLAGGLSLLAVSRRNELAIRLGALAVCAIAVGLLFLLLQATNQRALYEQHYAWLLGTNVLVAVLLLAVLLYALVNWVGLEEPRAVLAAPATGSVVAQIKRTVMDRAVALEPSGRYWPLSRMEKSFSCPS